MKKKFFSLINDAVNVHIAPGTKVIPQETFSELMDGKELLEKVRDDAERYRHEVIKEYEKLKEQAQKEGYDAGLEKWGEHLAKLEEEIVNVRKKMEKLILPVALKAAKKILGREIETVDTSIVDIVATSLKAVSQHKKFTIWVNRGEMQILEENKEQLKKHLENPEAFSLRDREDVKPGGCIIETEGGIINAQLDNQWKILERAFEHVILKKEPVGHS